MFNIEGPLLRLTEIADGGNVLSKIQKELKCISEVSDIYINERDKTIVLNIDLYKSKGPSILRNMTYLADETQTHFNENTSITLYIPYVDNIDKDIILLSIHSKINSEEYVPIMKIKGEYRNYSGEEYGDSQVLFDFGAADFWLMIEPPIRKVLTSVIGKGVTTLSSCGGHVKEKRDPYIEIPRNRFTERYLDEIQDSNIYSLDETEYGAIMVYFKELGEKEDLYLTDINRYL